MIYTMLILLENITPSEMANHPAILAIPDAINAISGNQIQCVRTSQYLPAPYIHPYDPEYTPPYPIVSPIDIRSHKTGYIYIETKLPILDPMLIVSALNDLPEFDDQALFLEARAGQCPIETMQSFIDKMKATPDLDESTQYIMELYELALEARHEVAARLEKEGFKIDKIQ